jgi:hypothetical protein
MEITSLENRRVKAAVRLRDRREREATGLTIIDGTRELARAIDAGAEIVEAFVCHELIRTTIPDCVRALPRPGRRLAGASSSSRRSPSANGPRESSRRSACPTWRSMDSDRQASLSSRSSRASRSRATWERSSERRRRRA